MTDSDMPIRKGVDEKIEGHAWCAPSRAGIAAIFALVLISGCAQGRGDWPTLSSALGWGGDGVPPPDVAIAAPAPAPAPAPAQVSAPDMMAWTPPPAPVPIVHAVAPPAIPVVPIASSYSYGNGSDLVTEAFSQGIAATSPTILTAPTGTEFATPGTHALSSDLSGIVPRVVLENYNQSLSQSVPGAGASALPGGAGGYRADVPASGIEYLDPVVIKFKRGSSRLSSRDKRRIGKVVKNYRSQGGTVFVIGHASSRTGDMKKSQHDLVNFDISLDRANAVTGELLNQGVAAEHLKMEARADRDPIYYEYMPSGEAGNRRVEIFRE